MDLFSCCWARMSKRIMGWTIANWLGWSLECCYACLQCRSFQVAEKLDFARFWEVEEIPRVKPLSKENHRNTTKQQHQLLMAAASQSVCLSCLKHVPRTTSNNEAEMIRSAKELKHHDDVKQQYCEVTKELVDMGYLEPAPQTSGLCYYFPISVCSRKIRRKDSVSCSMPASPRMASPSTIVCWLDPSYKTMRLASLFDFCYTSMRYRQM